MARDFAQVNIAIWQDEEFRGLPPIAQLLYLTLWTHPKLSYCGVTDWRPGRIAAKATGWSGADVRMVANCLESRMFLVIDEDSEECLVRSYVRFDKLLKQPRLAVSYANAYADVASQDLRGVIVYEAQKLYEREPDLAGWGKPQAAAILDLPSVDPRSRALPKDPFGDGFGPGLGMGLGEASGNVWGWVSVPPTTAPAPAPSTSTLSEVADAPSDRGDVERLCKHLADSVEANGSKRPAITKRWRDAARLMLDSDGRTEEQIGWLIEWCQKDEFWRSNILSMPKLRDKFDQLRIKATSASNGNVQPLRASQEPDQAWMKRRPGDSKWG